MKTFCVQTLGCRVNHYESEQIAELLHQRGLTPADAREADLRIVNTCSVTMQAASQSRQAVRRIVKLPVLASGPSADHPASFQTSLPPGRGRVVVTGCWATSHPVEAAAMPGVDAVLGHHHDLARELDHLLATWRQADFQQTDSPGQSNLPASFICHDISEKNAADEPVSTDSIETRRTAFVNEVPQEANGLGMALDIGDVVALPPLSVVGESDGVREGPRNARRSNDENPAENGSATAFPSSPHPNSLPEYRERGQEGRPLTPTLSPEKGGEGAGPDRIGAMTLPLLGRRQTSRQRAYLKIQDGCDAHCTYCIIPSLRPRLWSKPIELAVDEAKALVESGHVEIVLTGIFLGAYGQPTALRRRQPRPTAAALGQLVDALCRQVAGLRRLRLSSLEPGDLTPELLATLKSHPQVVPHFHLPLQSGSPTLLRRMNRQYTREQFREMIDNVKQTFDRPALTTDIVVGFPGETDAEFEPTVELVREAGFIHVHAFPWSPRPGTAAARWTDQYVRGPVVNQRIARLQKLAQEQSLAFRRKFLGETVQVIVERNPENSKDPTARHGRCERYFPVQFESTGAKPGDQVTVRCTAVRDEQTFGVVISPSVP